MDRRHAAKLVGDRSRVRAEKSCDWKVARSQWIDDERWTGRRMRSGKSISHDGTEFFGRQRAVEDRDFIDRAGKRKRAAGFVVVPILSDGHGNGQRIVHNRAG